MKCRRVATLSDRKRIALELIDVQRERILNGDDDWPSNWLRIADICRQEAAGCDIAIRSVDEMRNPGYWLRSDP